MEKRRIALLGATGYTGQRVLRELLARGEEPTLAGRNRTKMLALTGRLETDLPVPEVDVTSTADRARLPDRSDVVLYTVGPFMQLGIATVTAAGLTTSTPRGRDPSSGASSSWIPSRPPEGRPSCRPSATTTCRATSPPRSP